MNSNLFELTEKDRKRIVTEFCDGLKERLIKNVTSPAWPKEWNGCHIRAIAVRIVSENASFPCVKRAERQIHRNAVTYALPL